MTLILSEEDVEGLLDMQEVLATVETALRRQGLGEVSNSMRTRSVGGSSVLSVMHANSSYLGRGGVKAYMSSKSGARFVVVLFDSSDSKPLAIMGADALGRFRTGAASGVATKHLYRERSGTLALFGSGKQAMTQALAIREVMNVEQARVWSPNSSHREAFAHRLSEMGFKAAAFDSPGAAVKGSSVACSITSSARPFLTDGDLKHVSHLNICGSNIPDHAEATTAAIGSFDAVIVDDLQQGKTEYGDLIQADRAGTFSWDSAVELGVVVAGKIVPTGRTLFKSGGAALEDVAVASMLYDKAKSDSGYVNVELV